jgi:cyclic beta-1,2-glucan synthetase
MSIITGKESDGELFNRLEDFYLAEQNPNRFYAIVCNLPDSLRKKTAADEKIISSAIARVEALNAKYGEHFGIFVRERKYSRSEQKYIGWERKRGAVLELCRFMRGEKTSVFRYISNPDFLTQTKYLITLDADTNLYAGAADELIGTMLHPLNKPKVCDGAVVSGHAVIQPHIAPTLESSEGSAFSAITAGGGGVDSYAGAAFDIYENVFG